MRFRRTSACLSFTAAFYTTGALHVPVSTVIPVPYDRNILSLTAPILHTGSLSALMAPHPSSHLSVFDHRTLQPSESPAGESRAEEDAEDGIPDIADIPISEACILTPRHPRPVGASRPSLSQEAGIDGRGDGRQACSGFGMRPRPGMLEALRRPQCLRGDVRPEGGRRATVGISGRESWAARSRCRGFVFAGWCHAGELHSSPLAGVLTWQAAIVGGGRGGRGSMQQRNGSGARGQ